jgi:hypothetical protein
MMLIKCYCVTTVMAGIISFAFHRNSPKFQLAFGFALLVHPQSLVGDQTFIALQAEALGGIEGYISPQLDHCGLDQRTSCSWFPSYTMLGCFV